MRLMEIWFWWSHFLAQKSTTCLWNILQQYSTIFPFSYQTENRCIVNQCYLHQDLSSVWVIWWLSLQSVSASRQRYFHGNVPWDWFSENEAGTVTALMLFMCHFTNWSKQDMPTFHIRWRSTFPHHANSLAVENMI